VSLHQRNSQIWSDLIASSVQENFCLVFSIASSVTKILANKIVSLYSIFFSKIWYLYRFKRYIFEYRCPPLQVNLALAVRTCLPTRGKCAVTVMVGGWRG
jgi:hypothetical protein